MVKQKALSITIVSPKSVDFQGELNRVPGRREQPKQFPEQETRSSEEIKRD